MSDEQPGTRGEGLARGAAFPEKIATLMTAMANMLENHTRSLDVGNANAQIEREAYCRLVADQRAIASSLSALAAMMEASRDLPPAPHDEAALTDEMSIDAFRAFIGAEEDLMGLLQESISENRAMLGEMG